MLTQEDLLFAINSIILVASILLLMGIASSKFSARMGMPVLVMFLGLGMLAGSDGLGGIAFEDYSASYTICTLGLALILFSGGLSTPFQSIRNSWKPASVLATWGVLVTSVITGVAAAWILDIHLMHGLLLGSIVGSTDAAAVFSSLRSGGVQLRGRLSDTLEVESGSNDPMAIFLTVGLIEVMSGNIGRGPGLIWLFVNQMGIGLVIGILVGYCAVWTIRYIHLEASGLYPVLATAFGLLGFGLAAELGGSGFLSVYLTGLVIGNNRIVFQRGIVMFHDAAAWMAQIVMFIMLGLLSFPSRLLTVALPGFAIAAVLIFVARPAAVSLSLWNSNFTFKEQVFLSWVGLKGAVPITLAMFPLLAGVGESRLIFDVVFFVVLVSATLQGWTLPMVARWLNLEVPRKQGSAVTLEISSLRDVEGDIVEYFVDAETRVAGKLIREIALPDEVVISLIVRNQQIKLPKGSTRIEAGDHVIVVLRPHVRAMVDRAFARIGQPAELKSWPATLEFPLAADVSMTDLETCYDLQLGSLANERLGDWMRRQLNTDQLNTEQLPTNAIYQTDHVRFRVTELHDDGSIKSLSMSFLKEPELIMESGTAPPLVPGNSSTMAVLAPEDSSASTEVAGVESQVTKE